jgi:hypothetical protein
MGAYGASKMIGPLSIISGIVAVNDPTLTPLNFGNIAGGQVRILGAACNWSGCSGGGVTQRINFQIVTQVSGGPFKILAATYLLPVAADSNFWTFTAPVPTDGYLIDRGVDVNLQNELAVAGNTGKVFYLVSFKVEQPQN